MAGDWIKMRTNLDTDPRVIEIATELGIPELQVVGCLWKLWAWADSHSSDGNAIRVTNVTLNRFTVDNFADALRKVGWLEGRDGALTFPRFAEHNGQSAKKRCENKDRVAKHRNAKAVTDVTQKALPEKRREEKSNTPTHTHKAVGFETEWQRWLDFRFQCDGRHVNEIQAEQVLYKLCSMPPAKAQADIAFSIEKGAKSILDSNNDFSAGRKKSDSSKTKEYTF